MYIFLDQCTTILNFSDLISKKSSGISFPVDNIHTFEKMLKSDEVLKNEMRLYLKNFKPPSDRKVYGSGLPQIISREQLSQLNWSGLCGKLGFMKFKHINEVLYGIY